MQPIIFGFFCQPPIENLISSLLWPLNTKICHNFEALCLYFFSNYIWSIHCVNGDQIEKYHKNAMFFLNPRDLSENLSPWSIRSKDDIYQFWSSLLHCCFCKEHNIVLSKAGFTFLYNWIKSFMGSFLNLHVKILFHIIFWTLYDRLW